MTTIEVSSYKDLKGDRVSTASEKDRIIQLLQDDSQEVRVFRGDEWLWEDKSLNTGRFGTVVAGRIVAESEKAFLVTQLPSSHYEDDDLGADDPQTDWIPKSQVRVYMPGEDGIQSTGPQSFLGDWE